MRQVVILADMKSRSTDSLRLSPHLRRFIDSRVNSGKYRSAEDVVRTGLRLLENHEKAMRDVRRKIAEGLKASDEGRIIDGEAFFAQLEREESSSDKSQRRNSA